MSKQLEDVIAAKVGMRSPQQPDGDRVDDLGGNWSATLEIRERHSLVTHGVYRRVRHPMYAAHWLWGIAQALLIQNWIAGVGGLLFFAPLYLLRVRGDSMVDAGILDEDYVIIRKQPVANDGDIVVAMIDKAEATLKRFKRKSESLVALIPANAEMEPMIYAAKRVSIHGILVGQLRNYR